MSQNDRKLAVFTSQVRNDARPQLNNGGQSADRGLSQKPAMAGAAASRVLEVNRPWLEKGLQAICHQETNPKEREWVCKRLEFFVGSRRHDVSQTTEAQIFEYLEWQVKNGQKDWQVLQSLSAISYLLEYGCGRRECLFSLLREQWLEEQKGVRGAERGQDSLLNES